MRIYISILAIVAVALLAVAAEPPSEDNRRDAAKTLSDPSTDNLLDAVSKPTEQQNEVTRKEAEKLARSQVPTAEEASKLALRVFIKKPGLDARESLRVAGLYRLGRDVPEFAKQGDLVWEVHVSRLSWGISGVVWVSTTTKSGKVLFPVEP